MEAYGWDKRIIEYYRNTPEGREKLDQIIYISKPSDPSINLRKKKGWKRRWKVTVRGIMQTHLDLQSKRAQIRSLKGIYGFKK
jgi:hypothetical protein